MIIGISGLSGSGKDTVADILVPHRFAKISFADKIKRFLAEVYDWDYETLWGPSELRNKPDKRYPKKAHIWEPKNKTLMCSCCNEVYGTKKPCFLTPRYALKQFGEWGGRISYDNTWIDYAIKIAKKIDNQSAKTYLIYDYCDWKGEYVYAGRDDGSLFPTNVVIYDVRYINEFNELQMAGAYLVRVKRKGYEKPRWNHPSETEQMKIPDEDFDHIIENNQGLEELVVKTEEMLKTIN